MIGSGAGEMQQRQLGTDGPWLSVIGLGTWAIGGGDWKFGWGDQDDDAAVAAITEAVRLGINWIDTAAIYGEGRSEELVARALGQIPISERPLVATKCGRVALGNGEIGKCLRRDSVIAECEASLRRLQVECIDLYQMHWPEPDEEIEEGPFGEVVGYLVKPFKRAQVCAAVDQAALPAVEDEQIPERHYLHAPHVLVVEDFVPSQQFVSAALTMAGFQVSVAGTGRAVGVLGWAD